jgi:hypothetical protein
VEDTRSLLMQLVCPGSLKELVRALWVVSYATLFMGLNTGLHQAAAGPVFGGHEYRCKWCGPVRPCYWTAGPVDKYEVLGLDRTYSSRAAGRFEVRPVRCFRCAPVFLCCCVPSLLLLLLYYSHCYCCCTTATRYISYYINQLFNLFLLNYSI